MDRKALVELIINYLEKESLIVSPSTNTYLETTRYINEQLLSETDPSIIKNNVRSLTNEIINNYDERTHNAKRPTKVRDKDTRAALKEKWCSMPPFCKST